MIESASVMFVGFFAFSLVGGLTFEQQDFDDAMRGAFRSALFFAAVMTVFFAALMWRHRKDDSNGTDGA